MQSLLAQPPATASLPSLTAIEAEIERRKRRPKSAAKLAEIASGGRWETAPHLELLDQKLCDLAQRKIRRLIVTMPPRHGKSQLCSRYFPAWYLGTNPDHRVILCSYEANFAADWGGRARDVLEENGPALFGVKVRGDSNARDDWKIDRREGGMITSGVGGPITGRGADCLIIDDPVKNAAEASSETFRQRTWDWWTSTALTRVEPDGVVLVIMTRWNEDDLVGRLLKQNGEDEDGEDNERWHVLNLPAIAEENDQLGREPGTALWETRWPLDKLLRRMKRLGSYVWAALFQQRPSPLEGNYFKREWFDEIVSPDRVPPLVSVSRVWDLAATAADEASDPDWLVGTKMGKSRTGDYYVLHVARMRVSAAGVEATLKQFAASDTKAVKIRIEQEGAASGKIVKHHFETMLNGWDARFTPIPRASKAVRAGPFNAACERRQVHLVAGNWIADWIEELALFPNGKHDDQVDSASGAYESLNGNVSLDTGFYVIGAASR